MHTMFIKDVQQEIEILLCGFANTGYDIVIYV